MKKLLTLFVAALCVISTWAHDFQVNGIYYNYVKDKTNEVEVTYSGYSAYSSDDTYSGSVVIPSTVTYNGMTYRVTRIGEYAFQEDDNLTSVTIPNSVTSIVDRAFYECTSLTSVTIPSSVTRIGECVFLNCSSLTSVVIPNGVTSIGKEAFYNCTSLASVTIPESVTSIGEYAFYNCSSLTSVVIPNGVTSIGNYAFEYCSSLTSLTIPSSVSTFGFYPFSDCDIKSITLTANSVEAYCASNINSLLSNLSAPRKLVIAGKEVTALVIPNSVTSIGRCAFYCCTSLTSVTIPNSVTSIGEYAFNSCYSLSSVTISYSVKSLEWGVFRYCSSLTSVAIPESVTSIGGCAFQGCTSLVSVTIPESVTSIGQEAFSQCTSLSSVTIPSSVTSIGYDAFSSCDIKSITLTLTANSVEAYCASKINSLLSELSAPRKLVIAGKEVTDLVIPEGVTSIGTYAFYRCTSLASVTISEGVTSIGKSAFYNCTSLASVTILESVTSIGEYAFYNCSSLTSVVIPNGVTSIGECAFYNCSSLTSVTVPESVTSIGSLAFNGCDIKSITLTANSVEAYCTSKVNGLLSGFYVPRKLVIAGQEVTELVIPEGVTSIGTYAFYNCSSLASVTIPEGVTNIGYDAFKDCSSLTSVTIPSSVTSIGEGAFANHSIKSITLTANSVEAYCASKINSLLSQLSAPRKLVIAGKEVTDLVIPEGVTSIGTYAFYNCTSLASVSIPESVTSVEQSAFNGCDLKRIIISTNSVEAYCTSGIVKLLSSYAIPRKLFVAGTEITDLVIPESVTSIEDNAFYGCTSLASVSIHNGVTRIGEGAFSGCDIKSITLSANSVEAYCTSTIIKLLSSYAIPRKLLVEGTEITDLVIPNSVTSIEDYAFCGCSSLRSVTLHNSVTHIGKGAFYECLSLASVNLPKSLKSMGDDIFKGCVMTKGNFVNRSYWDVDNLNYWGASIVDEEIDGLLIKEGAIVDCRPWVTSVTIPEGVAVLRGTVFDGCDALQSITCKALIPLQWEAGSFFCPPTDNTMLYVPAEAIELYKNTYPWRNFYENIQVIGE